MVLPLDRQTRSEADRRAVGSTLPKHGHLAISSKAFGVCSPCPEPADGTRVGPVPSPTGSRTPGWIRRPSHFCASSERRYTVKSQSLQRKMLISACFNHCCQLLSWISLIYHASFSTEEQAEGCVSPKSECFFAPFTFCWLWK